MLLNLIILQQFYCTFYCLKLPLINIKFIDKAFSKEYFSVT